MRYEKGELFCVGPKDELLLFHGGVPDVGFIQDVLPLTRDLIYPDDETGCDVPIGKESHHLVEQVVRFAPGADPNTDGAVFPVSGPPVQTPHRPDRPFPYSRQIRIIQGPVGPFVVGRFSFKE